MDRYDAFYANRAGYQCLERVEAHSTDLYLGTCGMENCNPGHFFGPDKRDLYIIHFIMEGTGIYKVDGKMYNLSKGDFFVIYPDTEVYYAANEREPWDYVWVGFNGIKSERYLEYAGIDRKNLVGHCESTAYILSILQQILMSRTLTYQNEMRRQAYLLQILSIIVEEYQKSLPEDKKYGYSKEVYLNQAFDYISAHIKENIKVSDIASYIGINRSYLTSLFKNSLDVSPQEYIINMKMDTAEDMLRNTDYKVSYIASMVGYNDPLAFSKMFKKYKGISPSQCQSDNKKD